MPDAVLQILNETGPIAALLGEGYEPRNEQLRMASAVAQAMDDRSHLLVEAGTGVGKSFAYLVPAMQRCAEHGEVVVVATNTISLQEQLIDKDIPLLREAFPDDEGQAAVKPVLVKGRGNYVSIRRLKLASARQDRLFSDAASKRSLHVIEDWAYDTADGSLATLPQIERPGVWDRVQSDAGNCMGRRCPHHAECFYQNARRQMEGANLLICNHALFFSDLALRARGRGFLPQYQHVILDEAHSVEDVAAEHFGVSLTEGRVFHLLTSLYQPRGNKGYLPHLELVAGDASVVENVLRRVLGAESAARDFFDELAELAASQDLRNGRVPAPGMADNPVTPAFGELALALRSLRDYVSQDADRFELNAYAERASLIADSAEVLVDQTADGCVYWVESNEPSARGGRGMSRPQRNEYRRVTLACSPIDVAPLLREHLFGAEHSTVLTSATLATRSIDDDEPAERAETAFAHTIDRLGCEGSSTLQLGSPFDHGRQMRVYIDRTMPNPKLAGGAPGNPAQREYDREMTARVLDHLTETDGGAFLLFTSFAQLRRMRTLLVDPLADLGMPMLAQGVDGSRTEILAQFREDRRSVLLGAASFWQGVDVRGDNLRNVI
ncbi:MAG: ATP-dependent DNA helicase, partial [Planctomycetota bacterium]